MSLANVKANLATVCEGVTGVVRVYENPPDVAPTNADCPFILLDHADPFVTLTFDTIGHIYYTYHFRLTFGLQTVGTGAVETWNDDIEPYPARVAQALAANPNLSGAGMDLLRQADTPIRFGTFPIGATQNYFGFLMDSDVLDDATF